MNSMNEQQQSLEHSVEHLLSAQPPLRAPPSLAIRVLAEIERRAAAKPWWKHSFRSWPPALRMAFMLISLGAVKVVLDASIWIMDRGRDIAIPDTIERPMTSLRSTIHFARSIHDVGSTMLHSIPSYWIYAVGVVAAASYLTLIGVGTIAYRNLYR